MSDGASVLVIGGGVVGLSTAWSLTERGVDDVLVVERAALGSGGTGLSSGVVRCHYGVPSLAAMAWRSLPVLAGAMEILGEESGYRRTGYLVGVGEQDVEALRSNVAMQQGLGIEVELADHDQAAQLWPALRLDDFAAFAYEPCGGHGDGHQTALAFAGAARRAGARIRQYCPVASISQAGGRLTGVQLVDGTRLEAERVVLAAGAWSVALAATVGLELPIRPQRAEILIVDPGVTGLGSVPVLSDLVSLQYVRPEGASSLLVGDSDHSEPVWAAHPDEVSGPTDENRMIRSIAKFDHRFPGLDRASLRSTYSGLYDVTPDYNPIISHTPLPGLTVAAGFSGHGYKISPAVGRLVADLVIDGRSQVPEVDDRDFRLGRFSEGEPLSSRHPYVGAGQMR